MPPPAPVSAAWRSQWVGRWRGLTASVALRRPARIIVLVVVGATLLVDVVLIVGGFAITVDVAGIAATAAVALFVWQPAAAAAVLMVGMVVALPLGSGDAWLLVMAFAAGIVAATCSRGLGSVYVATLLVGGVFAEGVRDTPRPLAAVTVLLVVCAASVVSGLFFRESRRRQDALVGRLRAQAEDSREAARREREHLADELHDFIARDLTIIAMHARVLQRTDDAGVRETAQGAIVTTIGQALADVRRLLRVSQASRRDETGTTDRRYSLRCTLEDVRAELEGVGVSVRVVTDEALLAELSRTIDLGLAQIAREATANVVKHGSATRAVIVLDRSADGLRLAVRNDIGSRADALKLPRGGYGLVRMTERAVVLGGSLTSGAVADGWLVEVRLPLR